MPISSAESNDYPANPQHSAFVTPNWYYPDNSGFQFDGPPRYAVADWTDIREDGIYDVPKLPRYQRQYVYKGWTNWVDKFNKDYRFSSQSDSNARATLFPEVNDPWMYTEYLYEGNQRLNAFETIDTNGDEVTQPTTDIGVVEPPLVSPDGVIRTVAGTTPRGDPNITASDIQFVNNQPATFVSAETQTVFSLENKWRSDGSTLEYWQSELEAMGWEEVLNDGSTNRQFTRLNIQRRVVKYAVPYLNSGVRLFRHVVWSQSTRWGQSQNVPSRTINLTGPRDFFSPNGLFTGRIVPQISLTWGVPIYETLPDKFSQAVVRYDNYGNTATIRMPLFLRTINGGFGDPAAVYAYQTAPVAGYEAAVEPEYPRRNIATTLVWGPPKYVNNDLVHRGCEFWKGTNGSVRCSYYTDNVSRFQSLQDSITTYSDPNAVVASLSTAGHLDTEYEPVVFFTCTNSSTPVDISTVGVKFTPVYSGTAVISYSLSRANGLPVKPLATIANGGFNDSPGAQAQFRLIIRRKNSPLPDPKLCGMYDGPKFNDNTRDTAQQTAKQNYAAAGGRCPYYTPTGPRILGSYEAKATNGAEWANMQRGLPPGYKKSPAETAAGQTFMDFSGSPLGGGLLTAMALQSYKSVLTPDPFTNGLPREDNSRIEITYVPEIANLTGKSEYYATSDGLPKGNDPDNDIRIDPSKNFIAIEDHEKTTYGGVDTTFFGSINQTNYRLMHNVQHCFRSDKCTPIINSPGGNLGWRRGWFGGVDFTAHALRMPGYPSGDGKVDGQIKHCFTGDSRCPHNRLDRRAHEYNENYKLLMREILRPFRVGGIGAFAEYGLSEFYLDPATGKVTNAFSPNAMCVAAKVHDNSTGRVLGHWQPTTARDAGNTVYRIYFYYDRPSFDTLHTKSHVSAHIVQFDDKDQACYMKCPAGREAVWTAIYGNKDTVPWLVELYDDYREPNGNAVYVTNGKDFAGGRPPEYKDRSKIRGQIMCKTGGSSDHAFREGATDTNQFGGPAWNVGNTVGQIRRGYWVQREGEWILDSRRIGWGEGFVPVLDRISNKPGIFGHRTPILGEPGVSIEDPENPQANRTGDYASVGWTYSNDTAGLITNYRNGGWESQLPTDPFTGEAINVAPPNPERTMLPRERLWFQCDVCGIDFPEEEVNFLTSMTAVGGGLYYPLPSGKVGSCGCPRRDGGVLQSKGSYVRFLSCHSRGEVDVWGPPGTTVRHDGYFWKNPTMINRAHKDQMLWKLGRYNQKGGGYDFGELEPTIEQLGRLPAGTTATVYQPGLSHQITAPWAAPNETVVTVRGRVAAKFGLRSSDVAYVTRAGTSRPITVAGVAEATTILALGDTVQWIRESDGELIQIGIPVAAVTTAPAAVMAEAVVQNDDPIPIRSNYGGSLAEEKRYNADLRMWIVGVVKDSVASFSSTVYAEANAWARHLKALNLDDKYAKGLDPTTTPATVVERDERVIAPYDSKNDQTSLKLVTVKDFKGLRNRILPALGYDLSSKTYTAGGDFTDVAQAANMDRFRETRKPMPFQTYGTIAPQVLAANDTGRENYAEWDVGDVLDTKARAYYPTGMTWWRLNQQVGAIKRGGGTNYLHLDNAADDDSNPFTLRYSGDNVKSVCLFFLHGRVPMHMEVLKAYLIFTPNDAPSMEALGCQGQFTGNVSVPDFYNGGFAAEGGYYKGNTYCYWQHYHGYTTNHESDHPTPYLGLAAKNHVEIGHNDPTYFRDRGTLDNPGMPSVVGDWSDSPAHVLTREISADFDYQPFVAGNSQTMYEQHVDILGMKYEDVTRGFEVTPQGYFQPWQWGEDLVQVKTEHAIWKDYTYDTFETLRERYHVGYDASVDTTETIQSGEYYGSYFRNYIVPREAQPIPGYVNFTNYDTSGRFSRFVQVEEKQLDNSWATGPQVIVQETNSGSVANTTDDDGISIILGGGNGTQQAGNVDKVMDITQKVKGLYDDRVDRYFSIKLGAKYEDLPALMESKTDTNVAFKPDFHDAYNEPYFFWNYRYSGTLSGHKVGFWLNDPWHHAPLIAGQPAKAASNGDPIEQSDFDRDARIESVTDWDRQGLVSTDPNYFKYHPKSLMYNSPTLSTEQPPYSTSSLTKPVPADNPAGYWRMIDDQPFVHTMTWDLRSVPIETSRRPWRDQPPTIDSSNATCPNPDCFVHDRGWTVAQFLENSTSTWLGSGIIPSTSSSRCSNCHTPLFGVLFLGGDGILTVSYDAPPVDDPLISAFEISTDAADYLPASHHGFTVEYWNSVVQQWRPLFSVNWNDNTLRWEWPFWNGSGWGTQSQPSLPASFRGAPRGTSLVDENTNFFSVAAAKVRLKVTKPVVNAKADPVSAFGTCTPIPAGGVIVVNAITEPIASYVGRSVTIRKTVNSINEDRTLRIVEATGTGPYTFRLAGVFDTGFTKYQVNWKDYVARCTRFRVYGFPYSAGEVVITPPGYVQPIFLYPGGSEFRLNNWPTQISNLTCLVGEGEAVQMDRMTTNDPNLGFYWTTEEATFDGVTYLRISAGKWFYDPDRNMVVTPTQYLDPNDGKLYNIWDLNVTLYADVNNTFSYKTLPSNLYVEYFTGTGMPVDVTATACGDGPSYQLEPESVQFIVGENDSGYGSLPSGFVNDPLPAMGDSLPLKTNGNASAQLKWQAYNHRPLVWDTTKGAGVRWVVGDELGPKEWGDDKIFNVFTGNGKRVDEIKPKGAIVGTVSGTVTLYGTPGTLLSGSICVFAKAYTTKTYQTPTGPVTTYERTGGFRRGAFTFRLDVSDQVSNRRTGITSRVPRVLVFLRERQLDESL